jgi:hypothetical protein
MPPPSINARARSRFAAYSGTSLIA